MVMDDIYKQLNHWIALSNGELIEIGREQKYAFTRTAVWQEDKLQAFEERQAIQLPEDYKRFLLEVGSVELFVGEVSAGIEILSPHDVEAFSATVFSNYGDDLFPELFLTTSMPKWGYFGGFLLARESVDNYGIFYPEIPAELWIEEGDFVSFNDWMTQLVHP